LNAQRAPLHETEDLASSVAGIGWHPDGSAVAAASYGGLYICPTGAAAKIRHLRWKGSLLSVAWSPNGHIIASSSQDCSVHFWRLNTGKDSAMSGYPLKPKALAWDAASTLLATSGHATITLWQFRGKGPEGSKPIQLEYHAAPCTQLAFQPTGTLLASGGQDSAVAIWDPLRAHSALRVAYLDDEVTALAWQPQGQRILAGDARGSLTCWEL
jgi:WD40 repeat protein